MLERGIAVGPTRMLKLNIRVETRQVLSGLARVLGRFRPSVYIWVPLVTPVPPGGFIVSVEKPKDSKHIAYCLLLARWVVYQLCTTSEKLTL